VDKKDKILKLTRWDIGELLFRPRNEDGTMVRFGKSEKNLRGKRPDDRTDDEVHLERRMSLGLSVQAAQETLEKLKKQMEEMKQRALPPHLRKKEEKHGKKRRGQKPR